MTISKRLLRFTAIVCSGFLVVSPMQGASALPNDSIGHILLQKSDAVQSDFFRIPFLLRTDSDTLIAGADANRATTGDSADNIDAVIRTKPSASTVPLIDGWRDAFVPSVLDMKDFTPDSGYAQESASVIDAAIFQDSPSGRIYLQIDLFPWNGGVFEKLNVQRDNSVRGGRARTMALGDGFASINGRKMLLLSSGNVTGNADGKIGNINKNTDRSKFDFAADINGELDENGHAKIYQIKGIPNQYTTMGVDDSNLQLGEVSDFTLDKDFNLYENGSPLTVVAKPHGAEVPMKVFYKDSTFQVYNTQHVLQIYSDDEGQSWHTDRLVTSEFRSTDSRYSLVSPGRTIQLKSGPHAGRILVPVYTQKTGGIFAEVVFSDDGGKTWSRGGGPTGSNNLHESVLVEGNNGEIYSFNRNPGRGGGKVLMARSLDGGISWSNLSSAFGDQHPGVSSQVSAIRLKDNVTSPKTGESLPAIVIVSAEQRNRTNGVARLGVIHNDGTIEWLGRKEITPRGKLFAYSSVDQLADGRIALLFEASPNSSWASGLASMYYTEFTVEDFS